MILMIGGFAQGKLEFCLEKYYTDALWVFEGEKLTELYPQFPDVKTSQRLVIHGVHKFFESAIREQINPESYLDALVEAYPDCILISDEIGNGIVPMDEFQRTYRERVGRYLISLASRANEVERVICGIGQKIK